MTARGRWKPVAVAAAAAVAVAVLGAISTDLGDWYYALHQPAWKPPDWAFGPAWTLIFSLTAVAGVWAWHDAPGRAAREWLLAPYLVWVAYAGALNAATVSLNAPFGG
ncbi:tryptophan-rich sensory protein [Calidifontimicrobium sp. SYSU G02091]|uniref:tryptophan-rich sensory protein n=1 Tax=Calidifontimicrobium sp. SYSU G02091 TaxID=2926421 RepID=UPI001F530124|nr:TspO/MBR family protein [Calidifontimicrobium sp. SYSU G02091]MCI1193692.1 tryptophan-rich sensory protein [Calidifontimicrobium sp. SYSU G02091]